MVDEDFNAMIATRLAMYSLNPDILNLDYNSIKNEKQKGIKKKKKLVFRRIKISKAINDQELRRFCVEQAVLLINKADSLNKWVRAGFGIGEVDLYEPTELAEHLFEYIKSGNVKPMNKVI